MSRGQLDTEVQFIKGVGPKNAMLLKRLGIETAGDVLWHLPRRYEDRRDIPQIMFLRPGHSSTVKGRLVDVRSKTLGRGRVVVQGVVEDKTGVVNMTFFNQGYAAKHLQKAIGQDIVAYGQVREGYRSQLELHNCEWEAIEGGETDDFARIVPVYPLTEGLTQRVVRRAAKAVVLACAQDVIDPLPNDLRRVEGLPSLEWSLRQMHLPDTMDDQTKARGRLAFEEFLYLQIGLQLRRNEVKQEPGIAFSTTNWRKSDVAAESLSNLFTSSPSSDIWTDVRTMLPFVLTNAQKRVVAEIWTDMETPIPMNRLVQGDVGSGKTAVAACAILAAVRSQHQAAMMAPTEILAEQHYINLHRMFEPLGVNVTLLIGKLNSTQRKKAYAKAANGEAHIVVGTHALIQEGVEFLRLGLAVIDEQHRFGVRQRLALRTKGKVMPDVLVMTATPIPRTLTMAVYGDLDVSVIDELPPGRRPIKTHVKRTSDRKQVYETVRTLLEEGRQAYFVCPLIFDNEKMQAQAAEDLYYRLSNEEFKDQSVGLLHGQMKPQEKEDVMQAFLNNTVSVLVATTVIEVGVDVPNATIMVIEDADRFGLAQLHQLRGRVGRGQAQSYCVLIADPKSSEAQQRLQILAQSHDGFVIAEEDLKLRGPGDLIGTQQHGLPDLRVADLVRDLTLAEQARKSAQTLLEKDPGLSLPDHALIKKAVLAQRKEEALVSVS
ncbi:MAG: ATP-dependent DNA helicase RecG [Chthonomonadaceae bacterium]|nr:ATP-dependent DNA helicase RecG [Chthonomonadaceae bacterium]